MKLVFVVKTLSLPGGGAERVLATVASALARRGHEVTIATFDGPGTATFYRIDPAVTLLQLRIGHVQARTRPGEAVMRARSLRAMMSAIRPDVAVGFMHSAYVPLAVALVRTGIPAVGSEHIIYGHYLSRPFQRLGLHLAARLLDAMTTISDATRRTFPSIMRSRMHVMPNPVVPPKNSADVVGGEKKIVMSVGRLEPQKDQATLVCAFAQIAGKFPDWVLRIVGEGYLRPSLIRQIERLNMTDRIELPGATDRIGDEYARAQLFVIPSRYESFGLATAEAMVHGLPVIGFADCPGTSEIIRDGVDGLLVDGRHRVEGLAGAMAQLMRSPEKRAAMGEAARQTEVVPRLDAVVSLWEQLLASAAAARRGTVPGATR
jgi:GalNAc-alpha-(1->4)-GalNAc-alpha-(1->3)-diNAcBac-PP-undecaprenol alpha-1,4-N-acetyl-D-galactosaminyltransferase